MIERPKRSVTRFFIPLIDVLILLFCIFLLMPFMNEPSNAASRKTLEQTDLTPEAMKKEMAGMRIDLDRARKEIKRLQSERKDPTERLSVCVLEIDAKDGSLFYYTGGDRKLVAHERDAEQIIDDHKRRSGPDKEPFFVILMPHELTGWPSRKQRDTYARWFKDVALRFDNPLGLLP